MLYPTPPELSTGSEGLSSPPLDLDAYCARIGFAGRLEPTLDTLRRLIPLHASAIPFEAIDVLLGKRIDLSPTAIDAKLIGARRGGYCFEQNGLFRRVLRAIGFEVEGLLARVRWMQPPDASPTPRTHMVLRVTIDGEAWLADVGFGSSVPTAPLRLSLSEPQPTPNDAYRIVPLGGDTLVEVRGPDEWLPIYDIDPQPPEEVDFELANWFTATHPSSHFRQRLVVTRTVPEARYALVANRLAIRRPGREVEHRLLDADGIEVALADTFGLRVERGWRPIIERAAAAS